MKAVVLAGGKGTRLYPLTHSRPKPMVPLLGAPILAHILSLLAFHKVEKAALTVGYLADIISGYFKKSFCGVELEYFGESLPLGTAGAVKACRGFIPDDEPFIVISGDAVTDADLGAAFEFHREKNAAATLILKKCSDPLEFGVVRTDGLSRITGFVEKPEWSEVCSDKVNTGIYIISPRVLDLVPDNTAFDFSRDLFPMLLSQKERLFGFVTDGYWCDVGNPAALRRCSADALSGKIRLHLFDGARKQPSSPCGFVDPAATVASGALVRNSVVLSGSYVESGACVTDSVVAENCAVRSGSVVKDSVVDRGCVVGSGAVVCSDSVLGEGTLIDSHSLCAARVLTPGTRFSLKKTSSSQVFFENGNFILSSRDRSALARFGLAASKTLGLPVAVSGRDTESVGALCAGASSVRTFASDADSPACASFSAAVMGCAA
ncbi:MAG: NDP-sugar synthase, partial [Clostridia bacterium]|nr:NDP-sugar synthase [Clostridia bacterium]